VRTKDGRLARARHVRTPDDPGSSRHSRRRRSHHPCRGRRHRRRRHGGRRGGDPGEARRRRFRSSRRSAGGGAGRDEARLTLARAAAAPGVRDAGSAARVRGSGAAPRGGARPERQQRIPESRNRSQHCARHGSPPRFGLERRARGPAVPELCFSRVGGERAPPSRRRDPKDDDAQLALASPTASPSRLAHRAGSLTEQARSSSRFAHRAGSSRKGRTAPASHRSALRRERARSRPPRAGPGDRASGRRSLTEGERARGYEQDPYPARPLLGPFSGALPERGGASAARPSERPASGLREPE
jgi:hypothetical protein